MIHYKTLPHPDDLPIYEVIKRPDGSWQAIIKFQNGDEDDLGLFDTEEAATVSAQQWLDEYATLDQDEEKFLD